MVVSTLIASIRDIISDPDGTRWNDTRLIELIDEAQKDICKQTKVLRTTKHLVAHPDQANYSLPEDMRLLSRVLYNGVRLVFKSHDELDKLSTSWESDTGTPKYVVFDKLDRGILKLYPIPDFTENVPFELADATLMTIYYVQNPTTLVADTDDLQLDDSYKTLIEFYVSGKLLRSDQDSQNREFGGEQFQLYTLEIGEMKKEASVDFKTEASIHLTPYRVGA